MKANKWMSMALAMALTAGSGVSAYAAEVDTPADSSVPAEQQPAEDTPTVEIVEGMIEQLEQEIADDENDSAVEETPTEESTEDAEAPDDEAPTGEADADNVEEETEAPTEEEGKTG